MKLIATVFATVASVLLCQSLANAADDVKITRASLLTQPCFACHGANGTSVGLPILSLTGQTEDKYYETLIAFKTGKRPATLMNRIAKGYSDEDLKLIAGYLANPPAEAKPAN